MNSSDGRLLILAQAIAQHIGRQRTTARSGARPRAASRRSASSAIGRGDVGRVARCALTEAVVRLRPDCGGRCASRQSTSRTADGFAAHRPRALPAALAAAAARAPRRGLRALRRRVRDLAPLVADQGAELDRARCARPARARAPRAADAWRTSRCRASVAHGGSLSAKNMCATLTAAGMLQRRTFARSPPWR